MSYLSSQVVSQLIADPSVIEQLYNQEWQVFMRQLGVVDSAMSLNNALLASSFACIVAWSMKPYGSNPAGIDLASLLASPTLACNDYVRLTGYLIAYMPQCTGVTFVPVGWGRGPIGNHAQVFVSDNSGETMLLDPTAGLVVRDATYDQVASGKQISAKLIANFCTAFGTDPVIKTFNATVVNALTTGGYRPSHALYWCPSFAFFNSLSSSSTWPTPAVNR